MPLPLSHSIKFVGCTGHPDDPEYSGEEGPACHLQHINKQHPYLLVPELEKCPHIFKKKLVIDN